MAWCPGSRSAGESTPSPTVINSDRRLYRVCTLCLGYVPEGEGGLVVGVLEHHKAARDSERRDVSWPDRSEDSFQYPGLDLQTDSAGWTDAHTQTHTHTHTQTHAHTHARARARAHTQCTRRQTPTLVHAHTLCVFVLQILSGADITPYSIYQGAKSEAEVLLFPGTKLQVQPVGDGSCDSRHSCAIDRRPIG